MKNRLDKFDNLFIDLINNKMRNKYLDFIMPKITNLGGLFFSTLLIIILLLFAGDKYRLMGFEMFIVLIFSQAIVHSLKRLLSRERPYKILEQLNTFGINLKDYSFPSGHTAASFSIATTIAVNLPHLSILVFILAIIVGISRIYLGVHYPTDVVAGMFIGLVIAFLFHVFLLEKIYALASYFKFG